MIVQLEPGDTLIVQLKDTDGEFVIEYRDEAIRITTDYPDSDGREGVIYEERFAAEHSKIVKDHGEDTAWNESDGQGG